jgi:glycerol kinase
MSPTTLLAIDQGTTSTRAMLFDANGAILAQAQQELPQIFPADGWVEHDPEEIWRATEAVCRETLASSGVQADQIAAIGITNQRETTVIWDRDSGRPIHNAIVWQDRRTASFCTDLVASGHEEIFKAKTGLVLDPYFSGTKINWLLDHVAGARDAAEAGRLAFGTIDSFLLWRLTNGKVHATDATNASRSLLFNIHEQCWDEELLAILDIPKSLLPDVRDCASDFGATDPDLFGGAITIGGIAGDQHAATIGQACFIPGMVKNTYGTGCFVMLNTGEKAVRSENGLLTTVAYRLDGKPTYALEGSVFVAGAAIQWLRDGLQVIDDAGESERHALAVADTGGVYLVPAFTGLGAPHWDPDARGAILGLTRDSSVSHIVRAALESVCYQTRDLAEAMAADLGRPISGLRVDGGMVENNWLMQFQADLLNMRVERPEVTETTALGAAYLAGLQAGVVSNLDDITQHWQRNRAFTPEPDSGQRDQLYAGWQNAVTRVLNG